MIRELRGSLFRFPNSKIAPPYFEALKAAGAGQGCQLQHRPLSPAVISTIIPATLTAGAECWLILYRPSQRQESLIVTYPEPAMSRALDSADKIQADASRLLTCTCRSNADNWDVTQGYANLDQGIREGSLASPPATPPARFQILHTDRPIDEFPASPLGELQTTLDLPSIVAPWIAVTGLDGSGKTDLVRRLALNFKARSFRLPYHEFVKEGLRRSGGGTPFGDVYTDRLIMAADARLTNYRIRDWRRRHSLLVSQRHWLDNFVFGAVQGWSYAETDTLLRTAELECPSAAIFLVADPEVAFKRICTDPDADKFETPTFIRDQYRETLRLYRARRGIPFRAGSLRGHADAPDRHKPPHRRGRVPGGRSLRPRPRVALNGGSPFTPPARRFCSACHFGRSIRPASRSVVSTSRRSSAIRSRFPSAASRKGALSNLTFVPCG